MATSSQPPSLPDSSRCSSCKHPIPSLLKPLPAREGGGFVCTVCYPWVKASLARDHELLSTLNPEHTLDMVSELNELFDYPGTSWGDGFSRGGRWYGPRNSAAWAVALELFPRPKTSQIHHIERHQRTMGDRAHATFHQYAPRAAMRGLTPSQILQIIWILNPDSRFGMHDPVTLNRFKTMLALFSTPPSSFARRSLGPWAKSFQWLHRRVEKLPTARFILRGIEITGSSGNVYRITPKSSHPYYQVHRIQDDNSVFVCIDLDPRGKPDVVFGDILVSLTLALANDKVTALRITTLQQHVFGWRANTRHHRRRNIAFDHLFARAHGTAPVQGTEHDHLVDWSNRMRHLVHRFQTNLDDFMEEE